MPSTGVRVVGVRTGSGSVGPEEPPQALRMRVAMATPMERSRFRMAGYTGVRDIIFILILNRN
jgi:hypothetical protein